MVSGALYQDHSPRTSRLRQSTFLVTEIHGCFYTFTTQNDLISVVVDKLKLQLYVLVAAYLWCGSIVKFNFSHV